VFVSQSVAAFFPRLFQTAVAPTVRRRWQETRDSGYRSKIAELSVTAMPNEALQATRYPRA